MIEVSDHALDAAPGDDSPLRGIEFLDPGQRSLSHSVSATQSQPLSLSLISI